MSRNKKALLILSVLISVIALGGSLSVAPSTNAERLESLTSFDPTTPTIENDKLLPPVLSSSDPYDTEIIPAMTKVGNTPSTITATVQEFNGTLNQLPMTFNVGTFTYSIPSGHRIVNAKVEGRFGNSIFPGSGQNNVRVAGILVGQCLVDGLCRTVGADFEYQFTQAELALVQSGNLAVQSFQNTWSGPDPRVRLSEMTLTITTATGPVVSEVIREFPGFFLAGYDRTNKFDVRVDWKGTTGRVRFQINDNAAFEVDGTSAGAIKAFNLRNDFSPSYSPSLVKITAINGEGVVGETRTEEMHVFPYPTWLTVAISQSASPGEVLFFTAQPGEIRANFNVKFPSPEFKASGHFEESIPFIGGDFGIVKAQGAFSGFASSVGTGSLELDGETKFRAFGQELSGGAAGTGNFLLTQTGLSVTSASMNLNLAGTVSREVGLLTAVPALAPFRRFQAVRQFTDSVKLRGELSPFVAFATTWKQDQITRNLVFNEATGTVGLKMTGIVSSKITDRFKFQAWVAGGGNFVIGTPSPYLRSASVNFEAGAQLNIDGLFGGASFIAKANFGCTITTVTNVAACESSNSSNRLIGNNSFNPQLELIRPKYERFGRYEAFKTSLERMEPVAHESEPSNGVSVDETIVSNVFANAEPILLPAGNNGKLLLRVHQNPDLPVLQSTDLTWSYYNGTNWTTPAPITSDARAEFSPVAGMDSKGRVIAAWLKIKTPAFTTPVATLDDLPLYYKQVEVVSSVFDPATGAWSPETSLTNDTALDTSLRLARDSYGNLLLTWQSNPSGGFTADEMNPGTLKYSFWNGSSWNAPASVASNLANIGEHSGALKGNNAFIVLSHDPDVNVNNDSQLVVHNWNGTSWSPATVFSTGGGDNQSPNAAFDQSGKGQIVWLKGSNLVQANLVEPTPQIVRAGSESTAFYNIRLLNNAQDNLTLIWHEVIDNNPACIFAKFYDPNSRTWSNDRRLNENAWESKDTSGYYDNRGNLHLTYLSTQILRVTQVVTINGQTLQIPNVPENGRTDLRLLTINQPKSLFDYDGDGRSDISVWRQSTGTWYVARSGLNDMYVQPWGLNGDTIVPADYDGDGKTDLAVRRPSDNNFYVFNSSNSSVEVRNFGIAGDVPIPSDYNGDGKADVAVWRPSNGTWYLSLSGSGIFYVMPWGLASDKPTPADFDGDGKTELVVFRPSDGKWYMFNTVTGTISITEWGLNGDRPVPGDYNGDGRADFAVYRPSNNTWYRQNSNDGGVSSTVWGLPNDFPVPGDYDGDGKIDIAVWRPSDATWYINRSTSGFFTQTFGVNGDTPTPSAFVY